jgi:hypothetical protein
MEMSALYYKMYQNILIIKLMDDRDHIHFII